MRRRAKTAGSRLTYEHPGATAPAAVEWAPPNGYRAYETTVDLGCGEDIWDRAASAVLTWGVKTRSGFNRPTEWWLERTRPPR